ncbi:hypothetical protein ACIPZ8_22020 [Pseudomonas sp. NPDC089422]|uniref:hypothetical protein n=1 Tax=Pseudomonas sp. NPDC089422 TaxID=3364466 RepID=UPI0037FB0464
MSFRDKLANSAPFALRIMWTCLIAGPVIWLVAGTIRLSGLNATEAAAWIQAVGSIGAIIGACGVANWQIHRGQKQRDEDKSGRLRAIVAVVENAAQQAAAIEKMVDQNPPDFVFRLGWPIVLSGPLVASLQALNAVPVHELDDSELVVQCVSIMGALSCLIAEAESYISKSPEMAEAPASYSSIRTQSKLVAHSWSIFQQVAGAKISSPGSC